MLTIWKNRKQILEGILNKLFKKVNVEKIASKREVICKKCPFIDHTGYKCLVPGTDPCCSKCGCSLQFKLRSLSSTCGDTENPRWFAEMTEEEEEKFNHLTNK